MRSTDRLTAFATLFGAVACNAGVDAAPLPEGGGIDAAEGMDEGGAVVEGGADAGCGAFPEPNAWASWIMPSPARTGLPNPASYTVSDSGNQVTDGVTGLIWQRNLESRSFTWEEAKQSCACLAIDGVAGWRLPSRIELVSIADFTTSGPSIDSNAFPSTPSESFWTSSVLSSNPMLGYLVSFQNGHASYIDLEFAIGARCVRGQPSPATAPPGRYTIANGTAYDTQTKLTWQQVIPTSLYTWADATTYCSGLSLDGAGWRVPALGELQTIVDESTNPSIDGTTFPMTPSEYFWSSSALVEDPSRAWTCFFTNGSTYSFAMTTPRNVRCVR